MATVIFFGLAALILIPSTTLSIIVARHHYLEWKKARKKANHT